MDDRCRHIDRSLVNRQITVTSSHSLLLYSPLRASFQKWLVFLGTAIAVEAVYDREAIFNLFFQI
nr:hypothetical protein DOP62_03645 [Synechococcus elongatus PCC 11801]